MARRSPVVLVTLGLATLGLTASAAAQLAPTNQAVGWTSSALLPSSGQIQAQDIDGGCKAARRLCGGVLLNTTIRWAGGAVYDPRHESLFVSDSRTLEEWALVPSCKRLCTTKPQLMSNTAVVSGLAIGDKRQLLYMLETAPGYLGIRPWFLKSCPPTPTRGGCTITLAKGAVAAGIAFDELRDLCYYTVSTPGAVVGYKTTLYVASAAAPCKPLCTVPLGLCGNPATPMGVITGLAYDVCTKRLYASDGTRTLVLDMTRIGACKIGTLGCCAKQTGGGTWQGLAVAPGWKQSVPAGSAGCAGAGCAACSGITQRLTGGAPSLGNPDFGSQVANGPMSGFGIFMVGFGPCGTGLSLPFLCKPFYPSLAPAPLAIPGGLLTGTGSCAGSINVRAGVPVIAGACGFKICTQWLVLCGTTFSGWGMSQAIEFSVTGS